MCAEARASSRTRNACKETQKMVYGRSCGISEVVSVGVEGSVGKKFSPVMSRSSGRWREGTGASARSSKACLPFEFEVRLLLMSPGGACERGDQLRMDSTVYCYREISATIIFITCCCCYAACVSVQLNPWQSSAPLNLPSETIFNGDVTSTERSTIVIHVFRFVVTSM